MNLTCPTCGKNPAIMHPYYGWLPCEECKDKPIKRPRKQSEFTSEAIKEGRRKYKKDIEPAHRKGVASREFRDRYGSKRMEELGFSKKEIKNAKNVWSDNDYYKREE